MKYSYTRTAHSWSKDTKSQKKASIGLPKIEQAKTESTLEEHRVLRNRTRRVATTERVQKASGSTIQRILSPGRNCWRVARATRAAFLVDADAYFDAFFETVSRARESVLIIGWDIDSRVRLRREGDGSVDRYRLDKFLNRVVENCPKLQMRILIWDYALFFAMEREPMLTYKLDKNSHPRIHFRFDSIHPVGASHHQKIVVVDDRVAFCGGLDLTSNRWDTRRHIPANPARINPAGFSYGPFHDVHMMVEGECASALASLARDRWRRVTGQRLAPAYPGLSSPWPSALKPDMRDVAVGISRTDHCDDAHPINEVKALYLDAIRTAQQYLYFENQYLTSSAVGEALVRSLRKEKGPEVVVVTPREGSGWLEDVPMGLMRNRIIANCQDADRFDRFRIFSPYVSKTGRGCDQDRNDADVFVHSKVLVMDDRLVRIGSANLSNRSLGLDTECDLVIDLGDNDDHPDRRSVPRLLHTLLAEHLGVRPDAVRDALQHKGSLIRAIENLAGGPRSLRPISADLPEWAIEMLPVSTFYDPEEPLLPRIPDETNTREKNGRFSAFKRFAGPVAALGGVVGLAALWRFTELRTYIDPEIVSGWLVPFVASLYAPFVVAALFVIGTAAMFPVSALVLATALVFPPLNAFIYSMIGCLTSAAVLFAIGSRLGKTRVKRLMGKRFDTISQRIASKGILTTAILRNIPIAPFSLVNFAAGVSHLRFWDYIVGTALGMAPGVGAASFLGDRLIQVFDDPSLANLGLFALFVTVIAIAAITLAKMFVRSSQR